MNQSLHSKPLCTLIHVIVLAMSLAPLAGAQNFSFPAGGRFILPPSLGSEVLKQCSRPTPTRISKFWQPSVSDVEELELALPRFLAEREKSGRQVPPKDTPYHRQYVGFVENGERLIYANVYPSSVTKEATVNEATRPIAICDGGSAFWGVVYRVSTETFEEPHFNGVG
jgi:hypothetical protein